MRALWGVMCAVGLMWGGVAAAQGLSLTGSGAGGTLSVAAETVHYQRTTDEVTARGSVTAHHGQAVLTLDRLLWQRAQGIIEGEGHVRLVDGDNHLTAQSVRWNLNDNSGEIRDGDLSLEGRYHLQGALIVRQADDLYTVDDGSFSGCACVAGKRRPWSVSAKTMRLRPQGTLLARGVRFKVQEIPLIYLPVLMLPTADRQTGLLIPEMGSDTRNGLRFSQPFYWDISPSRDLTVTYDYRSKRGNGGNLEYRYMPSPNSHGKLRVNGIDDRDTGKLKGELLWQHRRQRDRGWSWYADVHTVNDRNFLRDFSDATDARTAESLTSHLFATRTADRWVVTAMARKITDLSGATERPVQYLPRLRAQSAERRVGQLPVWWGGHLDGVYLVRRLADKAVRVDAAPHVLLRAQPFDRRLNASVRAGARLIWYGAEGAGSELTEAYPIDARLSGQMVGRLNGRRHLIRPELFYRYVPVNNAATSQFDILESVASEHETGLTVQQRWAQINWRLTGRYDLDDHRPLPLRSQWDVALSRQWLMVDTLHSLSDALTERVSVDYALLRPWGQVTLGQLYDRGRVGVGTPFNADTLLAPADGARRDFQRLSVALGPWNGWHLSHNLYYDRRDHALAEARYSLGINGSCWSFDIAYVVLPDRNVMRFHLTLIGADRNLKNTSRPLLFGGG